MYLCICFVVPTGTSKTQKVYKSTRKVLKVYDSTGMKVKNGKPYETVQYKKSTGYENHRKVQYMKTHRLTLLLNDKHDEIPYRICRGCQFYSQSENANAKYMI